MQSKNQNDSVQLSTRYQQYDFAKRHLRGTSRPEVFPFIQPTTEVAGSIRKIGNIYKSNHEAGNIYDESGISPTIKCNGPRPNSKNIAPKIIQQLNQPTHSNDRVYGTDGVSPTLNTMQGGNRQPFIPEDSKIRRLTPIECERLQGFHDNWTEGLSDTQRYKVLGNAVTVNVIKDIMEKLI